MTRRALLFIIFIAWLTPAGQAWQSSGNAAAMVSIAIVPGIAASRTHLYWIHQGGAGGSELRVQPLNERRCWLWVFCSTPKPQVRYLSMGEHPSALTVAGSNLYWYPAKGIWRAPLGDGPPTKLVADDHIQAMAVGDSTIYWTRLGSGCPHTSIIKSVPREGGEPVTLHEGSDDSYAIVEHGDSLYWTTGGNSDDKCLPIMMTASVWTMKKSGEKPRPLATGLGSSTTLATDGANLYWLAFNREGPASSTYFVPTLFKMPMAGGTPTQLERWPFDSPDTLAVHQGNIYWILRHGNVQKMSTSGGWISTLARSQEGACALAFDKSHVYWGLTSGEAVTFDL